MHMKEAEIMTYASKELFTVRIQLIVHVILVSFFYFLIIA